MGKITVKPHRGAGPITFGMSREEVHAAMARVRRAARPRAWKDNTDCFMGASLQVVYGDQGTVESIAVTDSIAAEVMLNGLNVFDTPADVLLAALAPFDQSAAELPSSPGSYRFPSLHLTLWSGDEPEGLGDAPQRRMFKAVEVGTASTLDPKPAARSEQRQEAVPGTSPPADGS